MRHLDGKKCLITGAASGIGRALALAAARDGAALVLTDIDATTLEETVVSIRSAGGIVLAHEAFDVSRFDEVRAFADAVHAEHGSLDVLMNVAGIAIWGAVDRLEHRDWQRSIDVNLMGPIHVVECFVPAMIAAGRGGHLVNVSSAAGLFGLPLHPAYSASKFGLRGLSEVLRFDLRRHGIDVSLVCPGAVNTGLVRTLRVAGVDTEHPAAVALRRRFVRHAVSPERAAEAILRGVARRRFMVYTSLDIRLGHFFERAVPPAYALFMHLLNREVQSVMDEAALPRGEAGR